jgi:hypothetical protein
MKILGNNLDELSKCGIPFLYQRVLGYCKSFNDTESDVTYHIGDDFDLDLGGPIMLVENEEDLRTIGTTKVDGDRYLNLAEVADVFDVCEYIDKERYVYVLMCTHNGGGTTYIIPRALSDLYPTIEKSIFLTNVAWGHHQEDTYDEDNA